MALALAEAMDGFLALHFAAQSGHVEVLRLLVRKMSSKGQETTVSMCRFEGCFFFAVLPFGAKLKWVSFWGGVRKGKLEEWGIVSNSLWKGYVGGGCSGP